MYTFSPTYLTIFLHLCNVFAMVFIVDTFISMSEGIFVGAYIGFMAFELLLTLGILNIMNSLQERKTQMWFKAFEVL